MNHTSVRAARLPMLFLGQFVLSPLLGCAVEAPGEQPPSVEASNATETAQGEPAPLTDAVCNAQFDAMLAYTQKCGDATFFDQGVREPGRAGFVELCKVRGARVGTGYITAFHAQCTAYLREARCGDAAGLVKACWTPKGSLPHGAACNTDDQCVEGACILPNIARDGSGCGTCGAPARREIFEICDLGPADRCIPGSACELQWPNQKPSCTQVAFTKLGKAGDRCDSSGAGCGPGLVCNDGTCTAAAADGAACGKQGVDCRVGSRCDAYVCKPKGAAGEDGGDGRFGCDPWTRRDGTGTCRVEPALSCR